MPRPADLHKVLSMRLVCPSCRAEYEVDMALLPVEGREVQCSACHFIWFQAHPDHPAPRTAPEPAAPPPSVAKAEAQVHDQFRPSGRDGAGTEPEGRGTEFRDAGERAAGDSAAGDGQPRTVRGQALDILREEADFEARRRAREAEGLEMQPELGLAPAAPWPSTSPPETAAAARDDAAAAPGTETDRQKASKTPFPDIDDISTTLEPLGTARGPSRDQSLPDTPSQRRRSFLAGMAVPLCLAAVAIGPYVFAPTIIDAVPAAAEPLTGYVSVVDGLRVRLAGLLGG